MSDIDNMTLSMTVWHGWGGVHLIPGGAGRRGRTWQAGRVPLSRICYKYFQKKYLDNITESIKYLSRARARQGPHYRGLTINIFRYSSVVFTIPIYCAGSVATWPANQVLSYCGESNQPSSPCSAVLSAVPGNGAIMRSAAVWTSARLPRPPSVSPHTRHYFLVTDI